jgi:transposase
MESGAVLAVMIQPGATGDTTSVLATVSAVTNNVVALLKDPAVADKISEGALDELVTDKGYHGNDTIGTLASIGVRVYISEPDRGRKRWRGDVRTRDAVYANRRRAKGDRRKALMRRRGEYLERPFAHCLESGAMRRVHLRGCENIAKRYLVHVAACNLALLMRTLFGEGTPKGAAGKSGAVAALVAACARTTTATRTLLAQLVHQFLSSFQPARVLVAA